MEYDYLPPCPIELAIAKTIITHKPHYHVNCGYEGIRLTNTNHTISMVIIYNKYLSISVYTCGLSAKFVDSTRLDINNPELFFEIHKFVNKMELFYDDNTHE